MPAPRAVHRPLVRTHHGDQFIDNFDWLRASEDPEVLAHYAAENAWCEEQTADQEELRGALFAELKSRTRQTDLSVASWVTHHGKDSAQPYWYYTRTVEGREYPIHCRVPANDHLAAPDPAEPVPGEEILLDGNAEAEGFDFFSLGDCDPSPDGQWLAWSTDTVGDERYTLRFRHLPTGRVLAEEITNTAGGIAWGGNDLVFYTRADEAWRPHQVLRHRLQTDPSTDPVVIQEEDERFWLGLGTSSDEQWVLIGAGSKVTSEWHLVPVAEATKKPLLVAARRQDVEYEVDVAGDRLLIIHNDGATDFALAQAWLDSPAEWETLLPGVQGRRLLGLDAHRSHVTLALREAGQSALWIIPRAVDGALLVDQRRDVVVDETLRTLTLLGEADYDTDKFRYCHTSFVTPPQIVAEDVVTGARRVLRETPVLDHPERGPYRASQYIQERLWATAADGTRIPISLVRHRDTPVNGTAPLVVYGYGAYEMPTDPGFASWRLSLLERGVVWAIAHVRGGGELGRSWYEAGKFGAKPNTFTDFIACTQHLVQAGYGAADRVGAYGGSAGGLLMGAISNLAPELFTAVLAAVPFVDPLTSILNPDLPLTVIEWEEWGNPLADAEIYRVMKSYTPYENVRPVKYPKILAATSLNDTRVLVVEPAKWVARLREVACNDDSDVLLKVEMAAGHGGVSGRYQQWQRASFEFAWLLTCLGATAVCRQS